MMLSCYGGSCRPVGIPWNPAHPVLKSLLGMSASAVSIAHIQPCSTIILTHVHSVDHAAASTARSPPQPQSPCAMSCPGSLSCYPQTRMNDIDATENLAETDTSVLAKAAHTMQLTPLKQHPCSSNGAEDSATGTPVNLQRESGFGGHTSAGLQLAQYVCHTTDDIIDIAQAIPSLHRGYIDVALAAVRDKARALEAAAIALAERQYWAQQRQLANEDAARVRAHQAALRRQLRGQHAPSSSATMDEFEERKQSDVFETTYGEPSLQSDTAEIVSDENKQSDIINISHGLVSMHGVSRHDSGTASSNNGNHHTVCESYNVENGNIWAHIRNRPVPSSSTTTARADRPIASPRAFHDQAQVGDLPAGSGNPHGDGVTGSDGLSDTQQQQRH